MLRDLLDVLVDATRQSLRLRVEGRSTAPSVDPSWLVEAADFEILRFEEGSTEVVCQTQSLAKASPETFAQGDFFMPVDVEQSGLDVFEQTLSEVAAANEDGEYYDDKILKTLGRFTKVFRHGVESIGFRDGVGISVRPEDIETFSELKRSTPRPTEVRIAGRLDALTVSRRTFKLKLHEVGATVRGSFPRELLDEFKELIGQRVVVSGQGTFKPSGKLRKIETRSVRPAAERDQVWEKVPTARRTRVRPPDLRQPQSSEAGLHDLIGGWPGDESDDEIRQALEDLS